MYIIFVLFVLFQGSLLPFDVLLTTYDIALVDQDFLSQIPWQYAVIDEAQRLKNPNSVWFHFCLSKQVHLAVN